MRKLLLMAILFCTIILPMVNSKDRNAQRGLRRTVIGMAVFITVWTLYLQAYFFTYPVAK